MHLQDPTRALPLILANSAWHLRCEALHSAGLHGRPAQYLERCLVRQSEAQSGAGASSHAAPIRIAVRTCYVVIARFLVPCLGDGLFDRCTDYLFQTRWRAYVARLRHGPVRTGGSLQSAVLSRIPAL